MRYFVALKRTSEQQQNPPRFNLFRAKMNSQGLWIFLIFHPIILFFM